MQIADLLDEFCSTYYRLGIYSKYKSCTAWKTRKLSFIGNKRYETAIV